MRKPHVVYWQNIPSPHMVARFNALTGRGAIAFEAWFNAEREQDRSWDIDARAWAFRARFIPERSCLGRQWRVPLPELRAARPDLLVSLYDRAPFALGILGSRVVATRTALRALPNYDAWSERAWWKEAGKHVLFRAVDGAKSPGPDGVHLADRYGLPVARVHRVTQSIDVDHFAAARDRPNGSCATTRRSGAARLRLPVRWPVMVGQGVGLPARRVPARPCAPS